MADQVLMYQAKDGAIFPTEEEADNHSETCDIRNWFDSNPIYGLSGGCKVMGNDIIDYLNENPNVYIKLLSDGS